MKLISQEEAADLLNRSVAQIRTLRERGMPNKRGKIVWPDALHWYINRRIDKEKEKLRPSSTNEMVKQRRQIELRRSEIELAVAEGTFIAIETHIRRLTRVCERLAAKTRAFPGKYAPKSVGIRTITEGQAFLETIMRDLLAALSETEADDDETQDSRPSVSRAAPRRKRGRPRGSRSAA